MSQRNRAWLRTFLHLDAEAERENIPTFEIERQEDTVLCALDILDREPGVVLADEVGMGKTFEALGLMAAFRHVNPGARMLVLTPGADLNVQWLSNIRRFRENAFYDFPEAEFGAAETLQDLPSALEEHRIVFVPLNAFLGGRSEQEEGFLLGAYLRWARLREETRKQIASAVYGSRRQVPEVHEHLFMGRYTYDDLRSFREDVFERAFYRDANEQEREDLPSSGPGLANLYEDGGTAAFSNSRLFNRALARARFRLLNQVLPEFDLLIVDEAHKLKNAHSVRAQAVSNVLFQKYRKTAFLTATPFQLAVPEMQQVFNTFSYAISAPESLRDDVKKLFGHIGLYQERYAQFEADWYRIDGGTALAFSEHYERFGSDPSATTDANLRRLLSSVQELLRLKNDAIEPAFRRWMIRSVKREKFEYRQPFPRHIAPEGAARIPFLIYERLLTELYRRGDRTYKAAVELNVSSSFEAALAGSLLSEEREIAPEVDAYRKLLRNVLEQDAKVSEHHPKLSRVIDDVYLRAIKGEKTLIFSERVETIRALRKGIEERWIEELTARWRQGEPSLTYDAVWGSDTGEKGRHALLRDRFQRGTDPLYLALRENYLFTLLEVGERMVGHEGAILELANTLLRDVKTTQTSASRIDYRIAKRCVEQAAFRVLDVASWPVPDPRVARCVAHVLSPQYVHAGLDLEIDADEGDAAGEHVPTWTISEPVLELLRNSRGIWWPLRRELVSLHPDRRVRLAEAVTSFFVKKEVAFLPDLVLEAHNRGRDTSSMSLRAVLEEWWTEPGNVWRAKLEEFVGAFVQLNPSRQDIVLSEALKEGKFARDTLDQDAREKLREAFNTPFYPMILIGNQVMQEGLDLHRNCRRIVHYDLTWNPAQLEQRVGRLDRIGSLVRRKREIDGITKLEIHYPLVERTIDEHQYQVVREREKWLNLLLGAPPEFEPHHPSDPKPPPLPAKLVGDMTIELRPLRDDTPVTPGENASRAFGQVA